VLTAYVILPKAISVLLGFTVAGVSNLQDINTFLSFMLRLMVVFGIAYLVPLLVLMLNIVGVIKAKQLSKYRTLVIFGTFVFGAVATPTTDPFSMLALALPMSLLFIATELIAHGIDRHKAKALAGSDALMATDKALRELSQDSAASSNGHSPDRSQQIIETEEKLRDTDEPPQTA
jgi:sec-independent protein translocase protein TatC